jgi:hypothetical protein
MKNFFKIFRIIFAGFALFVVKNFCSIDGWD